MIEYNALPSSVAEPLEDLHSTEKLFAFTFTGYINEKSLYTDINTKLNTLETSINVDHKELETIIRLAQQLQLVNDEKEEIHTRITWLQRLYKAKAEMNTVDSKEQLKQLRNLIIPVQTCPLKKQLQAEIDQLEASLQDVETSTYKQPSGMEALLEKAVEEAGAMFINLGRAGREYVIAEVLKQHGDDTNIDHVRHFTSELEQQRVQTLLDLTDRGELISELEQLPLPVFSSLDAVSKERVVDVLIHDKGWTGLYSLDRRIKQVKDAIDREEREKYEKENLIDLPDGKAATTLDTRFTQIK